MSRSRWQTPDRAQRWPLRRGKPGVVEAALSALLTTYQLGDVAAEYGADEDLLIWEATVTSLWALGSVAVRQGAWRLVRKIVEVPPRDGGHYESLRHGQVMAARGSKDPADDNVLNVALAKLAGHQGYGLRDEPEDVRLRSLAGITGTRIAARGRQERVRFRPREERSSSCRGVGS